MKKLLFIPFISSLVLFNSCSLDSDGNYASATTHHYGKVENIVYSDTTNKIYSKYIIDALQKDSIVNVIYEHSVSIDIPDHNVATYLCDAKACEDYANLIKRKNLDLNSIKRAIFSGTYKDDTTFSKIIKGCEKYSDLDLKDFKVCLVLIGQNSISAISKDTLYIK